MAMICYHLQVFRIVCTILRALLFCMLCSGCASSKKQVQNQTLLPEVDVVQVKEYSEEALKLAQETKLEAKMLNVKMGEIDAKLLAINEELSSVSAAKIEELENRISLLVEAFKDLHDQVAAIELIPQIRIVKQKSVKPPVFSPSSAADMVTSSEYDMFQEALKCFDKHTYVESKKMFTEIIEKFPKGDFVDKSWYWIGESHYASGEYANAVTAFTKVFEFKNSTKADDAQFKLGLTYLRMGKPDIAATELKKLINRYPASEYIPRAEKYLVELKM